MISYSGFDVVDRYMGRVFRPGEVHLTSGKKGGGKSHSAIVVCEDLVKGRYPSVRKTILVTNMIFLHRNEEGALVRKTPENVYHITTMSELFPIVADNIERYGKDNVLIVLLLDEAQAFIMGDQNYGNLTVAMKQFMGIIRKFCMVIWFLTPTERSVGPAFRNFMDDDRDPGNVTVKWRKEPALAEKIIAQNHMGIEPRELIFVVDCDDHEPHAVQVPVTPWTTPPDKLPIGGYCYDEGASGAFNIGSDFDFEDFNNRIGDTSSIDMVECIREYYENEKEEAASKAENARKAEFEREAAIVHRLRVMGLTWAAVEVAIGMNNSTLRARHEKYCPICAGDPSRLEKDIEKASGSDGETACKDDCRQKTPLQKKRTASKSAICNRGGSAKRSIYISNRNRAIEGISENPSQDHLFEEGVAEGDSGHVTDTPIPDGKYGMNEFIRAADHCLGKEGSE